MKPTSPVGHVFPHCKACEGPRVETIIEVDREIDRLWWLVEYSGGSKSRAKATIQLIGRRPDGVTCLFLRVLMLSEYSTCTLYRGTPAWKEPGSLCFMQTTDFGVLLSASNPKGCSRFTVLQDTFSNACHS